MRRSGHTSVAFSTGRMSLGLDPGEHQDLLHCVGDRLAAAEDAQRSAPKSRRSMLNGYPLVSSGHTTTTRSWVPNLVNHAAMSCAGLPRASGVCRAERYRFHHPSLHPSWRDHAVLGAAEVSRTKSTTGRQTGGHPPCRMARIRTCYPKSSSNVDSRGVNRPRTSRSALSTAAYAGRLSR